MTLDAKRYRGYQVKVAELFASRCEASGAVWQQPGPVAAALPFTVTDGVSKPLSGINSILLLQAMAEFGWSDPRFFTAERVSVEQWGIKEGARPVKIMFAQWSDEHGAAVTDPEVKQFRVFNAQDLTGVPELSLPDKSWSLVEMANKVIERSGVEIVHDQTDKAFYVEAEDKIHMPSVSSFPSLEAFCAVAVHELGHASGHPSRLWRDLGGKPGDASFAREELRAELASTLLSVALGLPHDPRRHAGYGSLWAAELRANPAEIFLAARDAEKIASLVLWHVRSVEKEQEALRDLSLVETAPSIDQKDATLASEKVRALLDGQTWRPLGQASPAVRGELEWRSQFKMTLLPPDEITELEALFRAAGAQSVVSEGWRMFELRHGTDAVVRFGRGETEMSNLVRLERLESAAAEVWKSREPGKAPVRRGRWSEAQLDEMFARRQMVLAVDFRDKDKVSNLGAVWYPKSKLWFVPEGVDTKPLAQWKAKDSVSTELGVQKGDLLASFEKAMSELGLVPDGMPIDDGKWHYVKVDGSKGNEKPGAYVLNLEGYRGDGNPTGKIINNKTGETSTWKYDGPGLTPEQLARMKAAALERERLAEQEMAAKHEKASRQAEAIWAVGLGADDHGYPVKKGIESHGMRQVPGSELLKHEGFRGENGKSIIRPNEHYLLIPMLDEKGKLWSLQAINEDGQVKTFLSGGRKKGLMAVLGAKDPVELRDLLADGGTLPAVGFVEGFATGASLREATGMPVVVTFDAGNLETVANKLTRTLPTSVQAIIAGDNDQYFVERGLGALVKIGVARTGEGQVLTVQSGLDGSRQVYLGQAVADGEWHQAARGRYRMTTTETDGMVSSVTVEVSRIEGDRPEKIVGKNRGREAALEAAKGTSAIVALPDFRDLTGRPTDWNDLAKAEGKEAVRKQLIEKVPGLKLTVPERSAEKTPVEQRVKQAVVNER